MFQPLLRVSTALLVIDVQQGFRLMEDEGRRRNNPNAISNISELIAAFRYQNAKIFHIRHSSNEKNSLLRANQPGFDVMPEAREAEGEVVLVKSTNSSFIGTGLHERLREDGIKSVIICGATTNHCCETTARMAGNMGYRTIFSSDATWTFDLRCKDGTYFSADHIHKVTLSNLDGEFAEIMSTKEIVDLLSPN